MKSTLFKIEIKSKDGKKHVFRSDYGIESPEKALEEEVKLLKNIDIEKNSAVLVIDSRLGIEGTVIGDRARNGRVMMTSSKAKETLLTELNRRKNDSEATTEVMLTSDIAEDSLRKYDKAVYAPRTGDPLHIVKQKIFEASKVLRDDGKIVVASRKNTADKLKEWVSEIGSVTETIDGKVSVLEIIPQNERDLEKPLQKSKLKHSIKGEKVRFQTPKGYFNSTDMRRVEMIVREMNDAQGRLLDSGCGPGLAGIYSNNLYSLEAVSVSRDDYIRRFTEKNAALNEIEMKAYVDEGLEIFESQSFNSVAYNAKDRHRNFKDDMSEAFRVLRPGGMVYVVHSKELGAEEILRSQFSTYSVRRREGDLQVSSATK